MSDDSYKVQISGSFGEALFVLRGNSAEELLEQAKELASKVADIYDALTDVKQITLVKEVFTAKKSGYSGGGAAKPAASGGGGYGGGTAKTAPDGSHTCDHGAMKLLDYAKKDGSGYVHGYYCQAPRGDKKCAPIKLDKSR